MVFELYDYCWYWDSPQDLPQEKKHIGRWVGVSNRVGQAMVYYIMGNNGKVIARRTVSPLDPSEYDINETHVIPKDLDNTIKGSIGDFTEMP